MTEYKYSKEVFPRWTKEEFNKEMEYQMKYHGYKTEKGAYNNMLKQYKAGDELLNKPDIRKLEISVDWHRNRTWGYNPQATYRCWYDSKDDDCNFESGKTESASGCGYDKLSQVLSYVFDVVGRGMAYRKYRRNKKKPFPYGIRLTDYNGIYFEGGIGQDCYRYGIADYMGLKCTSYGSGDTYNYYVFEKKK